MRSHGCTRDPVANCLRIRQSSIPFTKPIALAPVGTKSANSRSQILVAMEQMLPKEQEAGGKYRPTLSAILEQFSDVLATSDEDLGRTTVIRHAIHTGDAKPVRCSPRRIAYHQRAQVETLLNEIIHRDVIEPSCNPWASPIVLVNKRDGSCRFCVDYRQLNNVTQKDAHPLPRIDDTLDALSGAQWFPTLDLASGYWQVEMETRDREKTAFKTPYGLYQFKVMPFGLCNAPATFQRPMETSLRGTAEEHTARLQEVLDRLRKVSMKVKPEKCQSMKRKVAYSGHIISEKGIATATSKTRAGAFDALKHQLTSAPILAYLYFRRRFLVDVNASGDGLGAVLRQKDGSEERVVAYASRSLTKPESRYCVTRRKMLGLVWALPSGSAIMAQTLRDQLLAAHQADPQIQLLRQWVTSGPWLTQCPHEYSRVLKMILTAEVGATYVMVLRALSSEIMQYLHNSRYAGHLGYSLHRLGMDILGPLEKTPSGNRYVLFLTAYFTKWTAAFPITKWKPTQWRNGHGRSFESRVVRVLCRLFYIKKTRSTPYHPQGNGQTVRFNRSLLDMLSIMCEENLHQSDEMLSFAMLVCNSTVNESTAVTPAVAMFGKELQLPLDIHMWSPQSNDTATLPNYIRQTRERIDIVHDLMRRQLKVQQRRQKTLYDRKETQVNFRVKELVWLPIPWGGQLHPCWEGPYEIVQTLDTHTYRVRHHERRRRTMVVHSDRLKKYVIWRMLTRPERDPFPFGTVPELPRSCSSLRKT
ncbi:Transposon Ty3-G Gag-Pol polyprotein [Trichinella murrelli]|uniref:Transposon Ty3-G Gag-Pol polyprotein n=1 Tax=Trichinella murrelli TaxID=144512 RepID=A0A0V0TCF1_9BILA|nr:Transposon Ty3-G Gag-Pol polyprotein [Trichinella murrelli]